MIESPITSPPEHREPTLAEALTPVVAMAVFLALGRLVFDAPIEILLIVAAIVTGLVALRLGYSWREMEAGIVESIAKAMPALLILTLVGALIASWIVCGTIPMIVYYGLKVISPDWFLVTACLVCCVISVVTGTSWGTIGTVGLALVGIAEGLGAPLGPTAGAVVAGSYFGDKLSPFSDTTNLAPIAARSNLYDHIAHLLWTTTPALLLSLAVYVIVGRGSGGTAAPESVAKISAGIESIFRLSPWLLLPPAITLGAAILKKPIIPGMLLSIVVAYLLAVAMQDIDDRVLGAYSGVGDRPPPRTAVRIAATMIGGPTPATGDAGMDRLIGRGGMARMMPTTLIAICAFCFAGIAQKTRMLEVLLRALTKITKTTGQLVLATVGSSILVALMTGNSYLSILIPGELFREAFKARDLAAKNLSRICEDAGTVVVPLVPWSIASVYITGVLNVPTADYAPWAIFCYTGFMFSILYGFTGFAIAPRKREDETQIGS